MAAKTFTDASIRSLKLTANSGERYERFEPSGLGLRVGNKNKSFIFLYRFRGRPRRMTLGRYPEMSLVDARVNLANAKKSLDKGIDPGAKVVEQRRIERKAETVSQLAEDYIAAQKRPKVSGEPRKKTWSDEQRMLNKDVLPAIGHLKANEVTRRDVIAMLNAISQRAPITSNRVHSLVRRMFNFGIRQAILETNPAVQIERNPEEPRERTLTDDEIKTLWSADLALTPVMRRACQFALLTGARRANVASAEWAEIDDVGIWKIPSHKTKNGRPHLLPLSGAALELLEENELPWLFPSPRRKGPISAESMTNGFRNSMTSAGAKGVAVHDLRRTCATRMAARGVTSFIVGCILGHTEAGVTARHYNMHDYLPEKRAAAETWASYLQEIVSGDKPASKIVSLAGRKRRK